MAFPSKPGSLSVLFAVCSVAFGCSNTVTGEAAGDAAGTSGSSSSGTGGATAGGSSGGASSGASGSSSAGTGGFGGNSGTAGTGGTGAPPPLVLDSGRVVLRRLNGPEYNNTVRDLLGTSLRPTDKIVEGDESAEGFDTVGDALSMQLSRFEVLEQGATELVDELFTQPATSARRTAVLVCTDAASETCQRQILTGFARRAFRRPVADLEITNLLGLIQKARTAGNSADDSLKAGLRAVLISPHFLYMVERTPAAAGVAVPVNAHELATRLSYLLWSSMPDAELFAAADDGTLASDPVALQAETARMLQDAKASQLTENFAGQWLTLRRLKLFAPSPQTFPNFSMALRDAAVEETERFLAALIQDNAPLETLVTADFSFVNGSLGQYYGVSASGADFQRVSLSATPRVGILGQLSFLGATSHPAVTSPSKRGLWVLEQLLCEPPNPPPPDVDIPSFDEPVPGQTVRQRLEKHREREECAGCHAEIDPVGFGLENFDAVGAYRELDNALPVDATGTFRDTDFSGAKELAELVATDPRLAGCVARQLLTYAVGRTFITPEGKNYSTALAAHARASGRTGFRDMIDAVVQSEAFRTRRGE